MLFYTNGELKPLDGKRVIQDNKTKSVLVVIFFSRKAAVATIADSRIKIFSGQRFETQLLKMQEIKQDFMVYDSETKQAFFFICCQNGIEIAPKQQGGESELGLLPLEDQLRL